MSNVVSMRREELRPPVNYAAEQALLGAILANNGVFHQVDAFLRPEHFADPLHGRIYAGCGQLVGEGKTADLITLRRVMDADLALQSIPSYRERGGSAYLIELAQCIVSVINAEDYGREITECYLRRQIMDVCTVYVAEAAIADLKVSADAVIEGLEGRLAAISDESHAQNSVVTAGQTATSALALAERALRSPTHVTGLPTGISDFDWRLGGLPKGLIILAGRPGMGKTSLAMCFALHAVLPIDWADPRASGDAVFFASAEMGDDEIGQKLLALRTGIGTDDQRRGKISEDQVQQLMQAAEELRHLDLVIDTQGAPSVAGIQSRARRLKRRMEAQGRKLALIVVDYIQLMSLGMGSRAENRVQELSVITRGLKQMQKALDVPVLALSQLSRAVEQRDDKRPLLADLRESGSIEQDADVVIFAYRDEYYLQNAEPKRRENESRDRFDERMTHWHERLAHARGVAEIIVAKNRLGPLAMVETYFHGPTGRFTNLRRGEMP